MALDPYGRRRWNLDLEVPQSQDDRADFPGRMPLTR